MREGAITAAATESEKDLEGAGEERQSPGGLRAKAEEPEA